MNALFCDCQHIPLIIVLGFSITAKDKTYVLAFGWFQIILIFIQLGSFSDCDWGFLQNFFKRVSEISARTDSFDAWRQISFVWFCGFLSAT